MGKTVEYQGYTIRSSPHYMPDGDKWQLHINISVQYRNEIKTREFVIDALYTTEQEADVHGIAYGQRLIDGKAKGQSVIDLKASDRRAIPRLHVQFRAAFFDFTTIQETGVILNLSNGGCRMESPVSLSPGMTLQLRIRVSDKETDCVVEEASVQWVSGRVCGLAFFRIKDDEQERLRQTIEKLSADATDPDPLATEGPA